MSDDNTENIVLDLLRAMRADISGIKNTVGEIKQEILSIKKSIHNLQGDALRREQTIAGMQVDLERIKARLDLADA